MSSASKQNSPYDEIDVDSKVILNDRWVHLGILIDRSASMDEMDSEELVGAATTLVKEQQNNVNIDRVTSTIANFDEYFEIVKRNIDASDLVLTRDDIKPRGMTSLVPALGRMITIIGNDLVDMQSERPGTVVIILLSDGEQTCDHLRNREESDSPYEGSDGYRKLSDKVKHQENIYKWKFFMLGTNFDAIEKGPQMGFSPQTCLNYKFTTKGGSSALRNTSCAVTRFTDHNTITPELDFDGYTQNERSQCLE